MPGHTVIVIGASAGGIEALKELTASFPPDLPAAIMIVVHMSANSHSVLPAILSRSGLLAATHAEDGQTIQPGHIYVAPPDHHLLVKRGYVTVVRGPSENGHRPAIDPMFRTAARAYGSQVIGVVLSGALDDGTAGLIAIKLRGGLAVVQDPEEALFTGMPESAIEHAHVDYVLPIAKMAALLTRLAHAPAEMEKEGPVSETMEAETEIAELKMDELDNDHRPGTPSTFVCPDCGGALWEIEEDNLLRYRCRVGHSYSAGTMQAKHAEALEEAFWIALRTLEENAALSRRLAERARLRGQHHSVEHFEEQVEAALSRAHLLREVLLDGILSVSKEGDINNRIDRAT